MLVDANINNVKQYSVLYHKTLKNADRTPARYRVLSVKTWKKNPRIVYSLKRGLYEYARVSDSDLSDFQVEA